jgi:hypothetical protein
VTELLALGRSRFGLGLLFLLALAFILVSHAHSLTPALAPVGNQIAPRSNPAPQ